MSNWVTSEIIEWMAKPDPRRFCIPVMSEPCMFTVPGQQRGRSRFIKRDLHPYILGILLGDGNLSQGMIRWTKSDIEIADRVDSLLGPNSTPVTRSFPEGHAPIFSLRADTSVKDQLKDLDLLGTVSETKFIPRIYLLASVEERWELLRGLMDTDGWAEADGDCYFGSVSRQLAEDVRHLARSLGAIVSWRERDPTYTYKGERLNGQHFYTLRIKMPQPERMFFLERKRRVCAGKEPQHMAIFLESIEPAGEKQTVCFQVRHPNCLYITNDFIVTHNTALICGLAVDQHRFSHIFRRQSTQIRGVAQEIAAIVGNRDGFNKQHGIWNLGDGRVIELAGIKDEDDKEKWQGRAADLKCFDEITSFTESQYRFIIGWNRSTFPGQRCRVIATGNPPTSAEGLWVIRYWSAWLDPSHQNPAKPGELRWYTTIGGIDQEVEGPGPHLVNGKMLRARSRTFIPSRLEDNPELMESNYASVLESLPEALRVRLRDGKFDMSITDDEWQVIPTDWVIAAQSRWNPRRPDVPMSAMGVDVASGGGDRTAISCRYGTWFAPLIMKPGKDTPDGPSVAAAVMMAMRDGCHIVLDMGGGWSGSAYDHMKDNDWMNITPLNPQCSSAGKAVGSGLKFRNKRAELWWRFREALDPSVDEEFRIALPPDQELRADLCCPKWKNSSSGIQIEEKDNIRGRLGRSPDLGDAAIMAWYGGAIRPNQRGRLRVQPLQTMTNMDRRDRDGFTRRRRPTDGQSLEPREMGD